MIAPFTDLNCVFTTAARLAGKPRGRSLLAGRRRIAEGIGMVLRFRRISTAADC